jgi:hypothetical protein
MQMGRGRFSDYLSVAIILSLMLIAMLSGNGCSSPIPLPEGWTTHIFKLLEHPETFTGGKELFTAATGYTTIADDTRKVLHIWDKSAAFDVDLPANGKVKFSYGFGAELSGYERDVALDITAEDDNPRNRIRKQTPCLRVERIHREISGRFLPPGAP